MNILLIVLHARLIGGLETYTRDVAFSLRRQGHTVSVLSVLDQPQPFDKWADIPIRTIAPKRHFLYRLYFHQWRQILTIVLRQSRKQYEAVWVMHPYAASAARSAGISDYTVWTYGVDVWGEWASDLHTGLANAKRIVAISTHTQDIVRSHLPEKRVDLVHPIVDTERFTLENPPREPVPPFRLLTVGRLVADNVQKGHDMVIRNLGKIQKQVKSPIEYWIAGEGKDKQRLVQLASEWNVTDLVHFCGRVPDEDLAALYRESDVFVMPSSREGFGIVYIEASACGKPVVGSSTAGASDAIQDGVSGFSINPESDDEFVNAVSRLLTSPELALDMGLAGRRRVEESFSPQALDVALNSLIKSL